MTSVLWSFAAWCAFALAVERHHDQVFRRAPSPLVSRAWCASGATGMLAALVAPVLGQGWALGVLAWVGAVAVAGCAAAALLAWRPRCSLHAAGGALLLGAVMAA
jgi:hypothetical protein